MYTIPVSFDPFQKKIRSAATDQKTTILTHWKFCSTCFNVILKGKTYFILVSSHQFPKSKTPEAKDQNDKCFYSSPMLLKLYSVSITTLTEIQYPLPLFVIKWKDRQHLRSLWPSDFCSFRLMAPPFYFSTRSWKSQPMASYQDFYLLECSPILRP